MGSFSIPKEKRCNFLPSYAHAHADNWAVELSGLSLRWRAELQHNVLVLLHQSIFCNTWNVKTFLLSHVKDTIWTKNEKNYVWFCFLLHLVSAGLFSSKWTALELFSFHVCVCIIYIKTFLDCMEWGMVAYISNPRTLHSEATGSQIWDQPSLYNDLLSQKRYVWCVCVHTHCKHTACLQNH